MSGDKKVNGTGPNQNRVNGTEDINMTEETTKSTKGGKTGKEKEGDEEMTVVVPPSKSSTTPNGTDQSKDGDLVMNSAADGNDQQKSEPSLDPKEKAVLGKLLRR